MLEGRLQITIDRTKPLLMKVLKQARIELADAHMFGGENPDIEANESMGRWLEDWFGKLAKPHRLPEPLDTLLAAAFTHVDWYEMGKHYIIKVREGVTVPHE